MGSAFELMLVVIFVVTATHAQKTNNESEAEITTQAPLSSTSTPTSTSTTTTAPSLTPEQAIDYFSTHETAYCTCDLYPFSCDIDCCCDHKCTEQDRRLFSRCIEENKFAHADTSCYSSNIIHSVSSFNQFVSSPSPKLFCVQYSNAKKQDFFENRKPLTSVSEIRKIRAKHAYGWQDSYDEATSGTRSQQQFLKSGDVLTLLSRKDGDGASVPEEWALPYSLITGSGLCDSRRSIRFLQSISTSCLRYIFSLEENCMTFLNETMFEGRFVSRRTQQSHSELQSLTTTVTRQSEKSSPTDTGDQVPDCLPHHQCLPVRDTSSPSIKSYFLSPQTACLNAVRKVSHEIFYDTDNGVVGIETRFQRINLTGSRGYLRQFFQVKFTRLPSPAAAESANDSDTDVAAQHEERRLSGNPGYVMSAPVLAAFLPKESVSNESASQRIALQTLQLPVLTRADGVCSLSAIKIQDVSFGVNFRSSCFVSLPSLSLDERSVNVCPKLQHYMTSMLETGSNVTHVGAFGNSNVTQVSEWMSILSENESPQVRDASRTAALSLSRKCPYLVTGFSYEIFFSFTGLIDRPQAKILSVVRRYTSQTGVRIASETSASGGVRREHNVELSTSVSFFDMTHSRRTSFAPAPVLRLQLPADFFYPFFISSSARPQASLLPFPCSVMLLLFLRGRNGF